MLHSDSWFAF